MSNSFNLEWARQTWKLLLYLEEVYQRLSGGGIVLVPENDVSWGVESDGETDALQASIGFEVNPPQTHRLRNNYLWVGLWLNEGNMQGDRPIWIQDLRLDDDIWNRLKQEFKEGLRMEEVEYRAVGLSMDISHDATNKEVQDAGKIVADRIERVLAPEALT